MRFVWLVSGLLLVGIGMIGVVVPGLPSTVFFIGAAACFARSSPRLEAWLLNLPRIGPLIRDYRAGLGLRRPLKILICTIIALAVMSSALFIPSVWVKLLVLTIGVVGIWFVGWHTPTRPT